MNTAVIIEKPAGKVIARDYLQEALKNCNTNFGITIQDKDDAGNLMMDVIVGDGPTTLDQLAGTIEACKDQHMLLYLGNNTQDFDKTTDLQPFVFQMVSKEDGGEPENILSVSIEGDFPNYSKPGAGHTDEYHLWENFIFPMLLEKFDLANSDPEDFYTRLRSSTTEQAITNTIGHRAAVVFVPIIGEPIRFGRNTIGAEYDWGSTSNRFKFGEQSAIAKATEATVQAVRKSKSRLAQAMGSTAPAPEITPPTPEPEKNPIKKDANGIHHVGATTHQTVDVWKNWPGTSAATHTMVVVPKKLQGNSRNRWIRIFLGLGPNDDLPKGKDNDGFMIPVPNKLIGYSQEDISTNDETKLLANKVKHFQTSGAVNHGSVNQQMKEANEQLDHTAPPTDKKIGEQRQAMDFLPEISADTKKGTVDLVTEWATRPNGPTMLEVQRQETNWPKFSGMFGIKLEDMLKYTIADRKALCKKYPDAAAIAWGQLQMHIIENGVGLNTQDPGNQKGHDNTEKKQVEVPSAQPQSAPAGKKKSRLAQLNPQAA